MLYICVCVETQYKKYYVCIYVCVETQYKKYFIHVYLFAHVRVCVYLHAVCVCVCTRTPRLLKLIHNKGFMNIEGPAMTYATQFIPIKILNSSHYHPFSVGFDIL